MWTVRKSLVALLAAAALCALTAAQADAAGFGAVTFVNSQVGWVAGDSTIFATVDGGLTWRRQYVGRAQFTSLSFINAQMGWAAGVDAISGRGVLLGTSDGGKRWIKLGEPPHALRSISFGSATNGWGIAGGTPLAQAIATEVTQPFSGGNLVSTRDGGRTWDPHQQPPSIDSVCASGAESAWLATQAAVIGTDDMGESFVHLLAAPVDIRYKWFATIRCAGPSVAWALFGNDRIANNHRPYAIMHTADGGATWDAAFANRATPELYPKVTGASDGPGNFPGPFAVVDASAAYFLGVCPGCGGVSIIGTRDGGKTWMPIATIPELTFGPVALSFADADHGWVVGTANELAIILATSDGGRTWMRQYPR